MIFLITQSSVLWRNQYSCAQFAFAHVPDTRFFHGQTLPSAQIRRLRRTKPAESTSRHTQLLRLTAIGEIQFP